MWEVLVRTPRGSNNPRKFSMLLATFFVACFAYIFATAPTSYAADAQWEGENVAYDGKTFSELSRDEPMPGDLRDSPVVYRYLDTSIEPNVAHFVFFSDRATDVRSEKEATYIRYTLNPPNRYTDEDGERIITVEPAIGPSANPDTEVEATSCAVDNIGWLVCGVGGFIADGIDTVYKLVSAFLTVQPLLGSNDNGLYNLWDIMRNFANILFVIGFLVVIYSYLAGGGFNGYEVRKIIPRVVVAAILINLSYWICALAVDASNIIGVSLQDLLVNIRETAVATKENRNIGWGEVTTYILSGGTIGALGFFAAAGGSITSLGFLLLVFLITVVFSLFVAFIILAARQAIIIMLIILAPLAFAAFILPNTEKWFDRWRNVFTTMLMLFPIFSLLFGGSQLAGAAIIQNAPDNEAGLAIMLFGMGVQIIPLVITPLLIQFSGNLLGRIAGVVNNAEKGMLDRSKGWATDRSQFYKDRALANDNKWYNFARRGGQRMYQKDVARQKRQEAYKKMAENRAHEREFRTGLVARTRMGQAMGMQNNSYGTWDANLRDADLKHQRIDAHHEQHWKERSSITVTDPNDPSKRIRNQHFDQNQFNERLALQTAQDSSKLADERFTTSYKNMQAGEDPYAAAGLVGYAPQGTRAKIDTVQATARDIKFEGYRQDSADVVMKNAGATALKNSLDLRMLAGGIGGEDAANRIYARAKTEVVSAYMDDVKNSRSVLSDYTAKQLVKLHVEGIDREGRQVYNPETREGNTAIVDAALQEIALNKGNNWAMQKMRDRIADEGMIYEYDENTFTSHYYDLQRDASGKVIRDKITGRARKGAEITDQEVIDRRRDVQQIFADAAKQSKLRVANLSQTDLGNFESGVSTVIGQEAIIRDIVTGKFDQNKIVELDVDELQRMVQLVREPEIRQHIETENPEALGKLMANIDGAQANKQINGRIKDRERGIMNAIAAYIDPQEAARAATPSTQDPDRSDVEVHYFVDPTNDNVRVPANHPNAVQMTARVQAEKDYNKYAQR